MWNEVVHSVVALRVTTREPNFISALARIYVDDLDSTIPFYRNLVGHEPHRFDFREIRLATIGPFLLIEGADENIRNRAATIEVVDVNGVAETIVAQGGALIEGPAPGPNGPRLIARHPDGTVVEYIGREAS